MGSSDIIESVELVEVLMGAAYPIEMRQKVLAAFVGVKRNYT